MAENQSRRQRQESLYLWVLRGFLRQIEDLPVKGSPAHSEILGRLFHSTYAGTELLQGPLDLFTFQMLQLLPERGLCGNSRFFEPGSEGGLRDERSGFEVDSVLAGIFQLPHISRPVVSQEDLLDLFRESLYLLVQKVVVFLQKEFEEKEDVLLTFAERRDLDRNDIQAIIE